MIIENDILIPKEIDIIIFMKQTMIISYRITIPIISLIHKLYQRRLTIQTSEPITIISGQLALITIKYKVIQNNTDILFKLKKTPLSLYTLHCNVNLTKIII